ncbi:MAG: hypothetical protein KDA72_09425, partial [Planctomycetales bacterium]|nr:hypothetical protein [Planctomycetales bacterium]
AALLLLCLLLAIYSSLVWWQSTEHAQPVNSNQLKPGEIARLPVVPPAEPENNLIDSKSAQGMGLEPWRSSELEMLLDSSQQQLQRLQSELGDNSR